MRIGFIGGWGHHYFSQIKEAQVAYAGDGHDNLRTRQRCEKVGGQWFDDAADMISQFKPDVINVGAVYGYNGDFAALALEHDIPVLCEKPIAATWNQYHRIHALCEEKPDRRIIVTEFPFRCEPAFVTARNAVRDGIIGKVVLATGQKSYRFGDNRPAWYASRKDYGGTIMLVAGHAIDFIRFVTDMPFTRVSGQTANISRPDYDAMEETTVTLLTLANGAPAVVHADYNRPAKATSHGDDRLRVAGSKGILEVRDQRCILITDEHEPRDITDTVSPLPQYQQMLAALQGQSTDPYSTAISLEMARILLHARDAADTGKTIDIQ